MQFLSTGQVADLLRVQLHRLDYLTRDRQIRPAKGPTGAFLWSHGDVIAAALRLGIAPPTQEAFRDLTCGSIQVRQAGASSESGGDGE